MARSLLFWTAKEITARKITLLPGDGIGPEVTAATVRVLEAVGTDFEWESYVVGAEAVESGDAPLPARVLDSIRRTKICLKGAVSSTASTGCTSWSGRRAFVP